MIGSSLVKGWSYEPHGTFLLRKAFGGNLPQLENVAIEGIFLLDFGSHVSVRVLKLLSQPAPLKRWEKFDCVAFEFHVGGNLKINVNLVTYPSVGSLSLSIDGAQYRLDLMGRLVGSIVGDDVVIVGVKGITAVHETLGLLRSHGFR